MYVTTTRTLDARCVRSTWECVSMWPGAADLFLTALDRAVMIRILQRHHTQTKRTRNESNFTCGHMTHELSLTPETMPSPAVTWRQQHVLTDWTIVFLLVVSIFRSNYKTRTKMREVPTCCVNLYVGTANHRRYSTTCKGSDVPVQAMKA